MPSRAAVRTAETDSGNQHEAFSGGELRAMNPFDLHGYTALVTGSSQGIGQGIATGLASSGATVIYHARQAGEGTAPPESICLFIDLTLPQAPEDLIDAAFEHEPGLDILVCNAGSFFDVPFLEMTGERWRQTMDLNVRAPFFLIQAFARRLIARGNPGCVIIVSSTNGFQAEYDSAAYDTSKGALVMMTRTLALSLADARIRVNSIAPGLIRTPFTQRWIETNHPMREHYERNIPLGRIGEIGDCAGAAVFLASPAASYITGQVLVIDGGLTISQVGRRREEDKG